MVATGQSQKSHKPVSRILSGAFARAVPVIYLALGIAAGVCAAYPPRQSEDSGAGRARPAGGREVYMAFQPARFVRAPLAPGSRALLPHVFTLACPEAGGCFL